MRGRGGGGGSRGGTPSRGGRGGGRGGFGGGSRQFDDGPPSSVVPVGTFLHACKEEMVFKSVMGTQIPYFNTPVYTKDITKLGMLDEIFGPINDVMFSVKPEPGVVSTSYKEGDTIYINPVKTLPLSRFLNEDAPKSGGGRGGGAAGRGRGGGGFRGGRGGGGGFRGGAPARGGGGFRGGSRGTPRGASRGFRGGSRGR